MDLVVMRMNEWQNEAHNNLGFDDRGWLDLQQKFYMLIGAEKKTKQNKANKIK